MRTTLTAIFSGAISAAPAWADWGHLHAAHGHDHWIALGALGAAAALALRLRGRGKGAKASKAPTVRRT